MSHNYLKGSHYNQPPLIYSNKTSGKAPQRGAGPPGPGSRRTPGVFSRPYIFLGGRFPAPGIPLQLGIGRRKPVL